MNTTEYRSVIAAYEQAIAVDRHDIPPYEGLGWLYISRMADFDNAIKTYERGLEANHADPLLTACLGSTFARMGQIEKALLILEESAKAHPAQVYAPSWLSYLYFRLKRLDEAAVCCRQEIELKDAHSPHRVLGFINLFQERNNEAVAELERAIELEAHDYEARAALAKICKETGDLSTAQYQFETGLEMSNEDYEYGQACFYAVYGEVKQALDLLETACFKGQVTPGWLHIDPELAFIQDEPRFKALLGERRMI